MIYKRVLNIIDILSSRSLFLFGPRQTGKTTYLRTNFPQARFFDLLEADTFRELSARPEILRASLREQDKLVVIDEIQKLPSLLDEVHLMIERNKDLRFILTGSSARKLRRGTANLLAGRALVAKLHPLVGAEIGPERWDDRLLIGSLPAVVDSTIPFEDLRAYVGNYLKEEIQAEALTRNIEGFSRFLETAAVTNGQQINFTAVGTDTGVAARTVQNYYQVLEDTLVGYLLPPFRKTIKRKAFSTSKFYFFDPGVLNALLGRRTLSPKTEEYGRLMEHQIFLELRTWLDYTRRSESLTYWRSLSKQEVDFIIGNSMAIEVKSKERIRDQDLDGIRALSEEIQLQTKIVVCREKWRWKTEDAIHILPINEFLVELWENNLQNIY